MAVKAAVKTRTKKKARPKAKPRAAGKGKRKAKGKSPADLDRFREWLLVERERLTAELYEIEHRTARIDEADRANELSAYEDHPADLASETFEREKDLAIGESVEGVLNKVITALEKIERGTYGTCDVCGGPIKKARLEALPFATLCVDCQGRLER
ncbi:MAG: TraR/DksA C4-type zinc finger protein [Armatimonadota bacterium]|nr:TraR/DksA C4-type zinc finger protein [Armatimonadota bacterium]